MTARPLSELNFEEALCLVRELYVVLDGSLPDPIERDRVEGAALLFATSEAISGLRLISIAMVGLLLAVLAMDPESPLAQTATGVPGTIVSSLSS